MTRNPWQALHANVCLEVQEMLQACNKLGWGVEGLLRTDVF
jgi:hypothetical protein